MLRDNWRRVGKTRRAGILVPLFSVYSKKSAGIGDFEDLKLLVDFCVKTGNSILQLLPMNEVGSTFCPYDAVSSFALEPSYISVKSNKKNPAGKPHVDYGIKDAKLKILRDSFLEGGIDKPREFKKFTEENGYWLEDFALFKVIKNDQGGKPWYEWEDGYKNRDTSHLEAFRKIHEKEIAFQKWVQFLAFNQFKTAKDYAESKGVKVCGDLPILMARDSADVWAKAGFFKLEFAAGAPPDMYCAKGQRWGVPTYNWEAIEADGYRYIKAKLKFAENFYDILRIDHVVGLFRIWSIPYDEPARNEGLNGFFDPRDEKAWPEHGRKILSVIRGATDMCLLGEDLGMIPKICPDTIEEFGIPGNDVQRWAKDWKTKHDFLPPGKYRKLAVAMLSTHDTTNWAAWWENEAGTIDETLFIRKCGDRGISYDSVKPLLFDAARSRRGRLRWLDSVASTDLFVGILGKKKEESADFIELYENSYKEKEKLWKHLKLKGSMREKSDAEIVEAALKITLGSKSIFSVELLNDYLYLADIWKGDPYKYRINRPGTVSKDNWSLVIPLPLEKLLRHKVYGRIKKLIASFRSQ